MPLKALERRHIKSVQREYYHAESNTCHTLIVGIFTVGGLFQVDYICINMNSLDYSQDVDTFQFYEEAKEYYTSLIDDPSHLFN